MVAVLKPFYQNRFIKIKQVDKKTVLPFAIGINLSLFVITRLTLKCGVWATNKACA